jgi:hypothetical protein
MTRKQRSLHTEEFTYPVDWPPGCCQVQMVDPVDGSRANTLTDVSVLMPTNMSLPSSETHACPAPAPNDCCHFTRPVPELIAVTVWLALREVTTRLPSPSTAVEIAPATESATTHAPHTCTYKHTCISYHEREKCIVFTSDSPNTETASSHMHYRCVNRAFMYM